MAGKKKIDPVSEAALEAVNMERRKTDLAKQDQAEREQRLAECHQVIGRIQATKMFIKFGNVSELMWMKDIKNSGLYRELPGLETWERFCQSVGYTARHINEQLENLEVLGADFLETVSDLRVGYRDLRKLRQLTHEGALQIEEGILVIGGEEIPLDADHREDLQAALERVIDAKDQLLQEKDINLRTKERLIADKQKLVERQAKDLARYEGEAERKGLSADEEGFIKRCNADRVIIDGLFAQYDPDHNPLPEGASIRMKAALMETLGYFKRVTEAAFDTAGDLYGDPELDGNGWVPPHLRATSDFLAAARKPKNDRED
jgi:hypothetical protein